MTTAEEIRHPLLPLVEPGAVWPLAPTTAVSLTQKSGATVSEGGKEGGKEGVSLSLVSFLVYFSSGKACLKEGRREGK